MSNVLIAFILAAGAGGFTYSRMGRRVGYGNGQSVLILVTLAFTMTFVAMLILLNLLLDLN